METQDNLFSRLKNQWKKERALLEQQNHLLALNVVDLKDRTSMLKSSNNALLNTIGTERTGQVLRAQAKAARLEQENRELRRKLEETSRERDKFEANKRKLKAENLTIKTKYTRCSQEKKIIKEKYDLQLKRLEHEFDKFRFSNDKMIDSLRNQVAGSRLSTEDCLSRRTANNFQRIDSQNASSVNICCHCVDQKSGEKYEDKGCLHRRSVQRISCSDFHEKSVNFRNSVEPNKIDDNVNGFADEIRRSIAEAKQERSSFGALLSLQTVQNLSNRNFFDIPGLESKTINNSKYNTTRESHRVINKENDSESTIQHYLIKKNRTVSMKEPTMSVLGFKPKRKNIKTSFGLLMKNSSQTLPRLRTEGQISHDPESSSRLETGSRDEEVIFTERPGQVLIMDTHNGEVTERNTIKLTTLRKDYQYENERNSESRPSLRKKGIQEQLSSHRMSREPIKNTEKYNDLYEEGEKKRDYSWGCDKNESRKSYGGLGGVGNSVRSSVVRESVQDCLNFNDILREKLANIESKLKCKDAN